MGSCWLQIKVGLVPLTFGESVTNIVQLLQVILSKTM